MIVAPFVPYQCKSYQYRYDTQYRYDMQAAFVTYRCPVGCSFWVKHRVREALTPRLRLVVGQPSNEKRSFPPAARLHLGKAARNGLQRVLRG